MRATFLGLILLSGSVFTAPPAYLLGQTAAKNDGARSDGAKGKYPYAAEPAVIERSDIRIHMMADGTGFKERTVAVRIQAESTRKALGVLAVPFAANSEHVEWVYARVRHGDGTVTETPVSAAMEMVEPVTREAPFYSDLKEMQLPLKDLRVGDRIEWQAKVIRTKAEAPDEFWGQESFAKDGVLLSQTVELEVPQGKYVQVWSPGNKPRESDEGQQHVYRWEFSQLKATVGPDADARAEAEKKRVRTADEELDDREGKLPDVAWSTFKSWEAVGAWYQGMEAQRIVPDAEVKAKVAQLTAGKTTEQEKVQALYGYVATQIHYIGVAFGIGRYQPHSAGDVLQNQYGDCKDKHTLLAAMLEAAGMHPDAVLIGAGIRFNEALPSPASFNHVLTKVEVAGKPVWLDTTAEVAPYGMLTYITRDRRALVVPPSGAARVERTPARPPFAPVQTMEATGTLGADGISTSRITLTFHGDDELIMRAVLRQISPAQYDQLAQQMCANMGYGGTASHLEASRPEDTSEPLKVSFDYKREKAGDWANYRTIPQLSPVSVARPDEKEPPVRSIELGVPRVELSKSAMKLPEGWGVELPEAVHEKSEYMTYDQTYRFEKGTMYAERRVEVLKERVPVSDWKSYNKFAESADLGMETFVQLVRTAGPKVKPGGKGSGGAAATEAATSMDPGQLVLDAYNAILRRDLKAAQPLLDSAKEINPKQARLWSTYGYLCFQRGEMETAILDYKKELSLHPEALGVYESMADAQYRVGRKAEANETLKTWIELDPANAAAPERLVSFLMAEGKPAEAAAAASAGLSNITDASKTEGLRLLLGKAQMAAGMKEKGAATLAELLRSTENSGVMNDAGYELADAGLELPLAETSVRQAVDRMEQETLSWTLDEEAATLRRKTSLLEATWDTMGWVLYREGKLDEAQNYVQASWQGRQSTAVGLHLGQIAAAKGDKNAALGDYELAMATVNPYGPGASSSEAIATTKDLKDRISALRSAGAVSPYRDEADSLERIRKIPMGSASGLKGAAEYKLLLSAGQVVRADATKADLPGGSARLQKTAVPGLSPAGSKAKLMRFGILNCHANECELILEP